MPDKKDIIIYTDGACLGNPGPGGYAAILTYKGIRKEISGGFRLTTNNRMELMAVIEALKAIKSPEKYKIRIFTDSRLIVNAFNQRWLEKWAANGWFRKANEKVQNSDLWREFIKLTNGLVLEINWVEGHSGITENENCDKISKEEAMKENLPPDIIYEQEKCSQIFPNSYSLHTSENS